MKRFIDLRGQHTGYRFAWWDTVRDCFDNYDGDEAWDTWADFAESVTMENIGHTLDRYRRLTPAWAFEPDPDDDFEKDSAP
jgi:hypothetical protein